MTRQQAKEKLAALGATLSDTVSQKTTALILGENPGSKQLKAAKLGIKIVSENDFLQLMSPVSQRVTDQLVGSY